MISLYIYFFFGLFFWITALMVFIRAKEKAFHFFSAYITINGLGIITRSIEFNGVMESYPHLHGLLHPFQYLYGPLYLFFLVKMFNQQHFFRKREIFHFLPFLLACIDTFPFYTLSADQKIAIIKAGGSISFFGIPENVSVSLKGVSYTLYAVWGIGYYTFYLYTTRVFYDRQAKFIHYWLRIDMLLKFVAVVSFVYFKLIKEQHSYTTGFYLFSLDSLFNVLVIYIYPSLLNGVKVAKSRNELKLRYSFYYLYRSLKVLLNFTASDKDVLNYLKYSFKVRKIHLNPSTNADLVSRKLSIRKHRLNEIAQHKFSCTLDEFIQFKRLECFFSEYRTNENMGELVSSLFKCGFNSLIDFQTCLDHYVTYPKREFLKVTPESVSRIQEIMKQTISKS